MFVEVEDASQSRLVGMELAKSTSIVRVVQLGNATRELNNCHTKQGGEWLEKPHANQIGTQRSVHATCSDLLKRSCAT
jgi:hypothetical protein